MSQPNNPQDDWRSPASRVPHRVSLGPLPKNDELPIDALPPSNNSPFRPETTAEAGSSRFRLPETPANEPARAKLPDTPPPTTGAPRFKMPTDDRPSAIDSGLPRVELKRLEVGDTPPTAAKHRGALPSPSELFEDSNPPTVTPRGWPPPRVSLADDAKPEAPGVPPSVTGFPPFVEESRASWEGPIGALERLKAGGSGQAAPAWPPPAASSWPPPAASSWPPAAPSTLLIPQPTTPTTPAPSVARTAAPSAPPRKKKKSSKAPLVGAVVVVVGVFAAVLLWPSGKKTPATSSGPLAVTTPVAVESKAPAGTRAPEATASSAAVVPVTVPSSAPKPDKIAEKTPQATSDDLPGAATASSATPATPETYSLNLVTEPSNVTVKIEVLGAQNYHGKGSGEVAIADVKPGTYHLKVLADGYKTIEEKVEIGADKSMKVTLHKKAAAPKPQPKPQPKAVVHTEGARTSYQPPVHHDSASVHQAPPRPYTPPPPRHSAPASAPARTHELRVNL